MMRNAIYEQLSNEANLRYLLRVTGYFYLPPSYIYLVTYIQLQAGNLPPLGHFDKPLDNVHHFKIFFTSTSPAHHGLPPTVRPYQWCIPYPGYHPIQFRITE
ncbi:MAG: hypothetical protein RR068_14055, partial [Hafnia sp.]